MAASLQAAATFMQPAKVGVSARSSLQLRSSHSVSKAFGVDPAAARLTCSLQADIKDLAQKCVDATKIAGFALATSALVVSVCISFNGFFLTLHNCDTQLENDLSKAIFHECLDVKEDSERFRNFRLL